MTLKIKTPTKRQTQDSLLGFGSVGKADARELLAVEIAARDAQWLELVGPVVEALRELIECAKYGSVSEDADAWVDAYRALHAITDQEDVVLGNTEAFAREEIAKACARFVEQRNSITEE